MFAGQLARRAASHLAVCAADMLAGGLRSWPVVLPASRPSSRQYAQLPAHQADRQAGKQTGKQDGRLACKPSTCAADKPAAPQASKLAGRLVDQHEIFLARMLITALG